VMPPSAQGRGEAAACRACVRIVYHCFVLYALHVVNRAPCLHCVRLHLIWGIDAQYLRLMFAQLECDFRKKRVARCLLLYLLQGARPQPGALGASAALDISASCRSHGARAIILCHLSAPPPSGLPPLFPERTLLQERVPIILWDHECPST
jgi:hypothetical protein